jgi:hypothetical protein
MHVFSMYVFRVQGEDEGMVGCSLPIVPHPAFPSAEKVEARTEQVEPCGDGAEWKTRLLSVQYVSY